MSVFILIVTVLAVVVALLRRRPLDEIVTRNFHWWGLLAGGFALHLLVGQQFLADRLGTRPTGFPLCLGGMLYLASFALIMVFLLRNVGYPGFLVVLVGLALNAAVISQNGGQMPGDPNQLAAAGILETIKSTQLPGQWSPYGLMDASTPLAWLGDRIFIPLPLHEPVIVSIGDLFIVLGLFLFFNVPATRPPYRFTSRDLSSRGW